MAVYDNKVLNGEHLSYLIGLIKTALNGKQPTIDGSHKLATNLIDTGNDASFVSSTEKSTWSGKQDALVFNTAYNASTNKVATMADIPTVDWSEIPVDNTSIVVSDEGGVLHLTVGDVPIFQVMLGDPSPSAEPGDQIDLQTYLDDYISPSIADKQDALVFNTAYNASSNKVATMADIPSVSGFQTASDVSNAISTALGGLTTFHFEVVSALPQSNQDSSAIYLVPKSTASTNNIYEEWAWVKTGTDNDQDVYGWENLGDTQVNVASLSNTEIQTIWESVS